MKKKLFLLAALATITSILFTGCLAAVGVGAAAGAGAVAYKVGELVATEATTVDKAWTATEKAFKELKLLPEAKERDSLAARMEAQGAGDKRIVVRMRNRGEKITEIRIRVGVFGDEGYSRIIFEKIKSYL